MGVNHCIPRYSDGRDFQNSYRSWIHFCLLNLLFRSISAPRFKWDFRKEAVGEPEFSRPFLDTKSVKNAQDIGLL